MIRSYRIESGQCRLEEGSRAIDMAADSVWIDLCEPTPGEETGVERTIGVSLPTREAMAEIEPSSRLYTEGDNAFMTAPLLIVRPDGEIARTDVSFVLTPRHLVTIRHMESAPIAAFAATLRHHPALAFTPPVAFAALMDALVDRLADRLEEVGREIDDLNRDAFATDGIPTGRGFRAQLQRLGRNGDIVSRASESLVGLFRMVTFARDLEAVSSQEESAHRLHTVSRDIEMLTEHAGFLSDRVTFLLDAMLGMLNIEQNDNIRTFSVMAVVFLPPTLIASIYGMNFRHLPELNWPFGYPLALAIMLISMVVPYFYFKRKGWF